MSLVSSTSLNFLSEMNTETKSTWQFFLK